MPTPDTISPGLLAERERIIRSIVAQYNASLHTKQYVADIFGGLQASVIDQVPEQELPAVATVFQQVRHAWRSYIEMN